MRSVRFPSAPSKSNEIGSNMRRAAKLVKMYLEGCNGLRMRPSTRNTWMIFDMNGKRYDIALRANSTDFKVFSHVFIHGAYNLENMYFWPRLKQRHDSIIREGLTPLIIDCGANIGASPLFFSLKFPDARVVAVEPEASNFALLSRNVGPSRVETIQKAIHSRVSRVSIDDPRMGAWAFQTRETTDSAGVGTVTIPQLIRENERAFVIKIDIEGFESELFEENIEWVAKAPLIILELHDNLRPFTGNSTNFLRAMLRYGARDFQIRGENIFSFSNDICP